MKKIFIILLILILCFIGLYIYTEDKRIVSNILKIKLPNSISNIECESWGFTDVLTTCVFEIEPKDFNNLVSGWEFQKKEIIGDSYDMGGGPKLGKNFKVRTQYFISPKEFKHGGHVNLLTNKQKNKVSIDIYIE